MFINKPLTNYDIVKIVKELKIKNFREVFMRDTLPSRVDVIECGIVNLVESGNSGTHRVCYYSMSKKSINCSS